MDTATTKDVPVTETPEVRVLREMIRRDPPGAPTDNRLEQTNHYKDTVYLAIHALGRSLSGATIRVMQRSAQPTIMSKKARRMARITKAMPGQSTAQRDHELVEAPASNHFVRLFEHINDNDTPSDLLMDWTIQRNLTGTAMIWGRRSKLGPPCELYVLPTALMYPAPPSGIYPNGSWWVQPYYPSGTYGVLPGVFGGGGVRLDSRTVYRHRMRHPLWRWDGYSPLTAGNVQIDVLEAIDQSRKAAMDHGYTPDAVVTLQGADKETCQRVEAKFREHTGSYNHRKVIVTGGQGKVDILNQSPREMDYAQGWEQMVKFASALFGVPPAIMGMVEAGSYAQLWASMRQFHTLTLKPMADDYARFLTKNMVRKFDKETVIQIDLPKVDDDDLLIRQNDQLINAQCMTKNQLLGSYGREPIEGGDAIIGAAPEGQDPSQLQGADGGQADPEAEEAGNAMAADVADVLSASAGPTGGFRQLNAVQKAFDPAKHPRGNPKNRGQFGHGGGGTAFHDFEQAGYDPKKDMLSQAMGMTGGNKPGKPGQALPTVGNAPGRSVMDSIGNKLSAPFKPLADFIDNIDQHADNAINAFGQAISKIPGIIGQKVFRGVQLVGQKYAGNQAVTKAISAGPSWEARMAAVHAPRLAKVLKCSPEDAQALMHASLLAVTARMRKDDVQNPDRTGRYFGEVSHNGKKVGYEATWKKDRQNTAGAAGNSGALPPRPQVKAVKKQLAKLIKSLR